MDADTTDTISWHNPPVPIGGLVHIGSSLLDAKRHLQIEALYNMTMQSTINTYGIIIFQQKHTDYLVWKERGGSFIPGTETTRPYRGCSYIMTIAEADDYYNCPHLGIAATSEIIEIDHMVTDVSSAVFTTAIQYPELSRAWSFFYEYFTQRDIPVLHRTVGVEQIFDAFDYAQAKFIQHKVNS